MVTSRLFMSSPLIFYAVQPKREARLENRRRGRLLNGMGAPRRDARCGQRCIDAVRPFGDVRRVPFEEGLRAGGIARRVESVEDVKEIIRQADEERRKP